MRTSCEVNWEELLRTKRWPNSLIEWERPLIWYNPFFMIVWGPERVHMCEQTYWSTVPLWSAGSWSRHTGSISPTLDQTHYHGRSTVRTSSHLSHCRLVRLHSRCSWHRQMNCNPPPNTHIWGRGGRDDTDIRHTRRCRYHCYIGCCWPELLPHNCSYRQNPQWPPENL